MTSLPLHEWRDFYVMIGTASGAIVGAAFVVATLTSGIDKKAIGLRGFITPTAVHLGSVLVGWLRHFVGADAHALFAGSPARRWRLGRRGLRHRRRHANLENAARSRRPQLLRVPADTQLVGVAGRANRVLAIERLQGHISERCPHSRSL